MSNTNRIDEVEFTKEFLSGMAEQLKGEAQRCEAAAQKIESVGQLPEGGGPFTDYCNLIRGNCILFIVPIDSSIGN